MGFAQVPICRLNGADGKVTVDWSSEDITAVEGRDYKGKKGIIVFESGEVKKNLEILIYNDKVRVAAPSSRSSRPHRLHVSYLMNHCRVLQ